MHKTIAIIPARGGSKGVQNKNIRLLNGKPLIAYTIEDAINAKLVDEVYVSTDDSEIAKVSLACGASIIERPAKFATDTASSESALIHAIECIEKKTCLPEIVVFLQCTSPLRTGFDIDNAIEKMKSENSDSLLSVTPSHNFLWHYEDGSPKSINYDYRQRERRQDMQTQLVENGSIYIFKSWVIKKLSNRLGGKISFFVMPEEKSLEIDSISDFNYVEYLIKRSNSDKS